MEEAKRLLSGDSYDLVLLDVNLPDGDGFQFAETVITQYDVPFIFLTAHNLEDEVIAGYRLGADDYITKPCYGENTGGFAQVQWEKRKYYVFLWKFVS